MLFQEKVDSNSTSETAEEMTATARKILRKKFHDADNNWLKKAEEKVPFKRLNKPLDVARILAFLCSDESGLMTGSLVDFDQTVVGWHSYSAYETKILDDSILGE